MAEHYRLVVTREGDQFLGEVAGLPGATYGATIAEVTQGGREIVILNEDLADDAQFDLEVIAGD